MKTSGFALLFVAYLGCVSSAANTLMTTIASHAYVGTVNVGVAMTDNAYLYSSAGITGFVAIIIIGMLVTKPGLARGSRILDMGHYSPDIL